MKNGWMWIPLVIMFLLLFASIALEVIGLLLPIWQKIEALRDRRHLRAVAAADKQLELEKAKQPQAGQPNPPTVVPTTAVETSVS